MAREYERAMAARLCRNGMGQKEAAQELGKSYQWVRKWVKREREESGFKDVPRSGRPRKIQEETRNQIINLLEDTRVGSIRRVKRKLHDTGLEVGKSTIYRVAREKGKVYKKRRRKPLLTQKQKEGRIAFARKEKKKNIEAYKGYAFYDESIFQHL